MIIPLENLEVLFLDFVEFIKQQTGETFTSFQKSPYLNKEENYKYGVSKEAKESLDQKHWKEIDIGTGKIQQKVNSAIHTKLHHQFQWHENNLVDWRKKDDFAKRSKSKSLEKVLFNFFKNKIKDDIAFENLLEQKISYQFIAYLFFIKDSKKYLPITQEKFDEIFKMIGYENFKTSGLASWENYSEFINIIKQVRTFLIEKDPNASLLDAHSFLYILGGQMKEAKFIFTKHKSVSNDQLSSHSKEEMIDEKQSESESLVADENDDSSFPEGKEKYVLHKVKERNRDLVKKAKEIQIKKDPKLSCQICSFSFIENYGKVGVGFIEAHHVFPISELKEETNTKIEDLIFVCSNCHRMLHRKRPWLRGDQLKDLLIT